MIRWKNIVSDPEFWFILVFNACIAWAYTDGLISKDTIIWIYFFQSVIIGMGNTIRIARLGYYLASNLTKDGQPVPVTFTIKWSGAIIFTIHYGIFHILYFIGLVIFTFNNGIKLDLRMVMINAGFIAINAILSTYSTIVQDREEKPDINSLFFTPYLRIMPMHFFLLIGLTFKANPEVKIPLMGVLDVFWLFLILKLLADLIMHIIIQKTWRGPRPKPIGGYI